MKDPVDDIIRDDPHLTSGPLKRAEPRWIRVGCHLAQPRLAMTQLVPDALAWAVAIPVTTIARYDLSIDRMNEAGVASAIVVAIALQCAIGVLFGLYRRWFHYGTFDEVRSLAFSMASVAVLGFALAAASPGLIPRAVPLLSATLALVLALIVRYLVRLAEDQRRRPRSASTRPVVVFGAGDAGRQIVRTMLRTPDSPYRPVALLDDDPQAAQLRVDGLRVEGTSRDLLTVIEKHDADSVLVAIPSATREQLRDLTTPLLEHGLDVFILPSVAELFGVVRLSDIRRVTIADVLGRSPAAVDAGSIAGYVRGRRVLVTGAGGSIGSELCRQLHRYGPESLALLDRDESGLHAVELSIHRRALLDSPFLALADIRDPARVLEVFEQQRPEVVFHAAALKHQPLLEVHPMEAWRTNVEGTSHVLAAAATVGVQRFINISTDKAADPISVLGSTKRLGERITAHVAATASGVFASVRFGNVLGSKGSMLGTFQQQVAEGGPITVTDPDVTRFFMTVEEAVALTIQAGALAEPGEVLVLDMGEPVRIADVATRLAEQARPAVPIVYTGLRPGEKLHEVLLGAGEVDHRPHHPLISQVPVPPLSFEEARAACSSRGRLVVTTTTLVASATATAGDRTVLVE